MCYFFSAFQNNKKMPAIKIISMRIKIVSIVFLLQIFSFGAIKIHGFTVWYHFNHQGFADDKEIMFHHFIFRILTGHRISLLI